MRLRCEEEIVVEEKKKNEEGREGGGRGVKWKGERKEEQGVRRT